MNAEIGKRPFVTANFALTWDGRISTRRSTPADFSSKSDKRRLVEIRAQCDAVLVSAKTVAADNMSMGLPDAALRAARSARGQREYPLRVLLTNSGRIDPALRLFTKTFSPVVIFSTSACISSLGGRKVVRTCSVPGSWPKPSLRSSGVNQR